jgi:mRNA interferase MazF
MSIPFHPRMGQVLVGDFSDLKAPEINKIRPVIVISPKLAHRSGLVAIVPISLTAPVQEFAHCHKLSRNITHLKLMTFHHGPNATSL